MPKGYLVAHIKVHDKEGFEKFKAMAGPVIGEYGGTVLARDPSPESREGGPLGLCIVIEFDSVERARAFYESEQYTAARVVREAASNTHLVLIEGV
ncbi:MAG: DUF1330 domain-containing protein [Pseudomonadota bacterium]